MPLDDCPDQACVEGECVGECRPDTIGGPRNQRCNVDLRERCSDAGAWDPFTYDAVCPSGCVLDEEGEATCAPCRTGDRRCRSIELEECNEELAFVSVETCTSGCVSGACIQGECDFGDVQSCVGDVIVFCGSEGTWVEGECSRGCDGNACAAAPPECQDLAVCCFSLSGTDAITCENVSERGSASGCQSTLDAYHELGAC